MDVKEVAQKHWPLLLGGAVGLFLIVRMRGGGQAAAPAPVYLQSGPSEAAILAGVQRDAQH